MAANEEGEERAILLRISFRGKTHDISIHPTAHLSELHESLEEITSVPSDGQKLLFKGKKVSKDTDWDVTLNDVGMKDGMKVQLLGSTPEEMDGLQRAEIEKARRDRIMAKREAKGATKARSTGTAQINPFIFHTIKPHPTLPNPTLALSLLTRLSTDPAIQHIMTHHRFSIGVLTELAPHEHPNLLGLNENRGEVIRLRVMTDKYDGLRVYGDVRRVLCHELAHCVWGEHDNNFKELNSLLNRQVAEYEASVKVSSHTLSSYAGPSYTPTPSSSRSSSTSSSTLIDPSLEAEAFAQSQSGHRLDSGSSSSLANLDGDGEDADSPAAKRRRILAATLRRLEREEKEIEDMCGSVGDVGSGQPAQAATGSDGRRNRNGTDTSTSNNVER